jgi:hypothetical protein
MMTKDTINQLTSSHILTFYMKFNSLYSTKPFYFDLISYLLRQCSRYDRLDLVNIIFARFVHDVELSSRKHVLVALVIKVWNVMVKIYVDKGQPEEVISSKLWEITLFFIRKLFIKKKFFFFSI